MTGYMSIILLALTVSLVVAHPYVPENAGQHMSLGRVCSGNRDRSLGGGGGIGGDSQNGGGLGGGSADSHLGGGLGGGSADSHLGGGSADSQHGGSLVGGIQYPQYQPIQPIPGDRGGSNKYPPPLEFPVS